MLTIALLDWDQGTVLPLEQAEVTSYSHNRTRWRWWMLCDMVHCPSEVGYSFQTGGLWLYRDTDGQQCSYTTTASKWSTVKGPKVCQVNSSGTITLPAACMGRLKRIIITPWSFGDAQHYQFEWHFPLATFFNKVFLAREPFAVSPATLAIMQQSMSLVSHLFFFQFGRKTAKHLDFIDLLYPPYVKLECARLRVILPVQKQCVMLLYICYHGILSYYLNHNSFSVYCTVIRLVIYV